MPMKLLSTIFTLTFLTTITFA